MIAHSFLMVVERLSRRGDIFLRGFEMSAVSIWELLAEIGFNFDSSVILDGDGMSINLGRLLQSVDSDGEKTVFKLNASKVMNKYFRQVVMLSGHVATARSMEVVFSDLPLQVSSRSEDLAFVAYGIPSSFDPKGRIEWLREGRAAKELLPWEKARLDYAKCPSAIVGRDWMRLAFKSLREIISTHPEVGAIDFGFEGGVLKIVAGEVCFAMTASGKSWPSVYSVAIVPGLRLPSRLMSDSIEVAFREDCIVINDWRFPATIQTAALSAFQDDALPPPSAESTINENESVDPTMPAFKIPSELPAAFPDGSTFFDVEDVPVANVPLPNGGAYTAAFDPKGRLFDFSVALRNGAPVPESEFRSLAASYVGSRCNTPQFKLFGPVPIFQGHIEGL